MAELTKATTCSEASPEGRVVGSIPAASTKPRRKTGCLENLGCLRWGLKSEKPHRPEHSGRAKQIQKPFVFQQPFTAQRWYAQLSFESMVGPLIEPIQLTLDHYLTFRKGCG